MISSNGRANNKTKLMTWIILIHPLNQGRLNFIGNFKTFKSKNNVLTTIKR